MMMIEVRVTVMDVHMIVIVAESCYPATAGGLLPPDSPHQNHLNPAPLARSLAKTEVPALEPKA